MNVNITEYLEDDNTLYKADKSIDEIASAICNGEHVTWMINSPDWVERGTFTAAFYEDGYPSIYGIAFDFDSDSLYVMTFSANAYIDEESGELVEFWERSTKTIAFS